jgi:hypothetical protein
MYSKTPQTGLRSATTIPPPPPPHSRPYHSVTAITFTAFPARSQKSSCRNWLVILPFYTTLWSVYIRICHSSCRSCGYKKHFRVSAENFCIKKRWYNYTNDKTVANGTDSFFFFTMPTATRIIWHFSYYVQFSHPIQKKMVWINPKSLRSDSATGIFQIN